MAGPQELHLDKANPTLAATSLTHQRVPALLKHMASGKARESPGEEKVLVPEAPPWAGWLPLGLGGTASCRTAKDRLHLEPQKESMEKNNNNNSNSPVTSNEGGTSLGHPHRY